MLDVNECNRFPCRNGARCTDLRNGYTCGPCPVWYTGKHCERRKIILLSNQIQLSVSIFLYKTVLLVFRVIFCSLSFKYTR